MSGRRFGALRGLLLVLACMVALAGCKRTSERDFVGKWQSSRAVTPIHLAANGEWEIRQDDGTVLQYGVWRYADKTLIWSIKQGERIMDDPTPVLSVESDRFTLKERNGTTTVFKRLP
ncbi:hypothetical protein LZ012_00960 [Dechloromonas sp. XY25]|uniref:Lipocalin-like domain-containing protein n=1 Tax=Dechloromonas hankyongensis TaxID=2908002 RepID=A0ABS9JXD2_9RHOO|nr:hypothetical protein [Dechloromonas hankyongensis]MCG2575558.1 hypothetical protein [Dechloromonas hankyongensis]